MKINNEIIKKVIDKLYKSCDAPEDMCRICASYNCPKEKAFDIEIWWKEREIK